MNQRRFRISLRTAVVLLGLTGAVIGLLGRLYRYEPEMFLWAMHIMLLLVFIALVLGLVYWRRYRNAQWANVCILCAVLLLMANVRFDVFSPESLRPLPTWYLVERKLFQFKDDSLVDYPRVWKELDRRLIEDRLTNEDARSLFAEFEQNLREEKKRPIWRSFSDRGTLRRMTSRGMVENSQLVSLAEAYFGPPPTTPLRIRVSPEPLELRFNYGDIGVDRNHPTKLIWHASRVQLDGKDVEFDSRGSGSRAAVVTHEFDEGTHMLRVTLDCAFLMHDELTSVFGGAVPPDQWPKNPLKTWTQHVELPLTVYAADAEIISLTSNPELNPINSFKFKLDTIAAGRARRDWLLSIDQTNTLPVAVSGDLFVTIDGQRFSAGALTRYNGDRMSPRAAFMHHWPLDPKNVSGKTATVEFIPNATYLEHETDVSEVWGGELEFKNVPVDVSK